MKNLALINLFILISWSAFSQSYQLYLNEEGQASGLKLYLNDSVYRFDLRGSHSLDQAECRVGNQKFVFSIPSFENTVNASDQSGTSLQVFEPGESPEGDMVHDIEFSPDGRLFAVLYKHSNNIYFYDSAYQLLEIVEVGDGPIDMVLSHTKAYVCCEKSNEIYVINLRSFSIKRVFPIPENSCQVEVSPDETQIFIGCYSWLNGAITSYSLTTYQQLYYNTQPYIHHYGYYGNQGRCTYQFAKFFLSPDGDRIVAAYTGSNKPAVFDAGTGNLVSTFNFGSFRAAAYSVTADTLLIFSYHNSGNVVLHRLQSSTLSVIDSIIVAEPDFLDYTDLVVSEDGQRAMVVDSWTEKIYHFDFNTHSCNQIPESIFSNPWIKLSGDRKIAAVRVFGDVHFYRMDNGILLSELYPVTEKLVGNAAAISPVSGKIVCCDDNLFYGILFNEYIYGVDFDEQANLTLGFVSESGQPLEADMTTSAIITTDGSKLVSTNILTQNTSFINYWTGSLDTLMNLGQVQQVVTIPGSDLLIFFGYNSHDVWFVNSTDYTVEAVLSMNQVAQCVVSPLGDYAYLYTVPQFASNGTLYKVQLNGNIEITEQFQVNFSYCGLIIVGDYPEVSLLLSISPDGKMMLFPDDDPSLGPVIRIVDLELMNVMATIQVNEVCTYDYAFSEDSKYALIGSYDEDLPLIYLNGSASYLIKYIKISDLTFSITYNKTDDLFYVLQQHNAIVKVNPVAGAGVGTITTNQESAFQIGIDNNGIPVVMQAESLLYQGESYSLPGVSRKFTFDANKNVFVIPTPGPDAISVFNELNVGKNDIASDKSLHIYPNPAKDYIIIDNGIDKFYNKINISILDLTGKVIIEKNLQFTTNKVRISLEGIPAGYYLVKQTTSDFKDSISSLVITD
ncbi:MAG: T9SS type A sorting domain-containing protein [Bacteroidales bacterium]|nr:T9SS type A sorting domain-containing protein [Bacteroidales bacterium]